MNESAIKKKSTIKAETALKYLNRFKFSYKQKESLSENLLEKKKKILIINQDLERSKLSPLFFRP